MEKRSYQDWYLSQSLETAPRIVQQELEFRFKLFPNKKEETK